MPTAGRVLRQIHVESIDFLDAEVAEHERGTIGSHAHPTDPIPCHPLWNLESRYALNLAVCNTNAIDDRSVPIQAASALRGELGESLASVQKLDVPSVSSTFSWDTAVTCSSSICQFGHPLQ